jgi:hypothetical protein
MKVPTYEAQSRRPTAGGRQFLTAQLSASAMTAPGQAAAQAGQQLAAAGNQIFQFGLKKMQVGADNEAAQASAQLNVELQQLQTDLLQNPNMANADKLYAEKSRNLVNKFKSGLSNSLARDAFTNRARQIEFSSQISFNKRNNDRVVEAREINFDRDVSNLVEFAGNVGNSDNARALALSSALQNFENAIGDFGPEKTEEKRNKFYERLARTSLAKLIDSGADISDTVDDFASGNSQDPILAVARDNLTQEKINKISKETVTTADRTRKLRDRKFKGERELAETNFEKSLTEIVKNFKVNEDMTSEETSQSFAQRTDELMNQTLDAHEGSSESKAELSIQLKKLRTKHSIDFGELQFQAKKDNAKRGINRDIRSLASDVQSDPLRLADSMQLLDATIDEQGATFYSTEEEELARQGGREDLIESALDGYLLRGKTNDARELFNSAGISSSLSASVQENYRRKFIEYDEKNNKFANEYNAKIKAAEAVFGPLTNAQKAEVIGVKIGSPKTEMFKDETSLRKEFTKLSKDFVKVQDSYFRIKTAAGKGTAPGDLSLIFNFMKMLDPGSVVRESEFRTAEFAASVPERIRGQYKKVIDGTRLSAKSRAAFVTEAENLLQAQQATQAGLEKQFRTLSEAYGFNPDNVVLSPIGLGRQEPESQPGSEGGETKDEPEAVKLDASGNVIK